MLAVSHTIEIQLNWYWNFDIFEFYPELLPGLCEDLGSMSATEGRAVGFHLKFYISSLFLQSPKFFFNS